MRSCRLIGAIGLHLARIIIFVQAPGSRGLWASGFTAKISGLQGSKDSPFEILNGT